MAMMKCSIATWKLYIKFITPTNYGQTSMIDYLGSLINLHRYKYLLGTSFSDTKIAPRFGSSSTCTPLLPCVGNQGALIWYLWRYLIGTERKV